MKDVIYDEFQNKVDEVLIRHANLLDILSKMGDAASRTNRAVVKSITNCGCVELNVAKVEIPENLSYEALKVFKSEHLQGKPCPACREKIEEELGKLEFYIAALCNTLDINLYDVILKEYKNISTLGRYSLY
ncbi:nucleoside triphosphate pyrophosphohydrolase family protein [Fusibacter bizertensis]